MVFSGEEPGWQVWFEGDVEGHDTDALVGQVARQLEEFTQIPNRVDSHRLTDMPTRKCKIVVPLTCH